MARAKKYSLAISLTALCLCFLLFRPSITSIKTAWPQDESEIQTLISELKGQDPNVRRKAVAALREIGPEAKAAVPALIEALKDQDERFRRTASAALAYIGPGAKAAVPALIEALKDQDEVVRANAAGALGRIGPEPKTAVPALIEALKDESEVVRGYAAGALGDIGPDANAAVPALIEALKHPYAGVRGNAARALGYIGPEAKAAVPALLEALKDQDEQIRWIASQTLGNIGPEALPALIKALKDEDKEVRWLAARGLQYIGPEAKAAVPALIGALKDQNEVVRRNAATAMAYMGPEAKAAVPALIEALKDQDERVRGNAAAALGNIGPEAKAAVPALIEALKDENEFVRSYTAEALGGIATALSDAKSTDMIKDLRDAKKALSAYTFFFSEQENTVRRAIEYLEQFKPPLWKIVWNLFKDNILISSLILAYSIWVMVWLIVFWLHALVLLRINQALKPFDFQMPKQFGSIKLPLRFLLFVGFLNYRPRVLDAWVKKFLPTCRDRFSEKRTVYDRQIHISVPVEFDRQTIPDLTAKELRLAFARQICCLLIWGEGGSGKTSLACQIAKWAMEEDEEARLCEHLMLPVLIEQELSSKEDQSAFIDAVGRQLQDVTDQANPIPEELLERLLRNRRVLVLVDHLSEMSEATRKQINLQHRDFPANAFIVTSRLEDALGGVTKTLIRPLRIRRDRLSPFMEAYLTHRDKSDLFTDSEFHHACGRLSDMVGERDITVLLAKLYAEQMIAAKEGLTKDKLPDNIPELMLGYLNELNRAEVENKLDDLTVQRDAKVLAWACLKERYKPVSIRINNAIESLGGKDANTRLDYFEKRLRLIETVSAEKDKKFLLDPLAEYLAGLHLLEVYGKDEEDWKQFLVEADKKQGAPEAIKGFLLAVRDCIIAKVEEAKVPKFIADKLAKRAGLDMEAIKEAQIEYGDVHKSIN